MAEYQPVLKTAELGPGHLREVEVRGEALIVVNLGQTYYAFSALCPYAGTNLAREGRIDGDTIVCPVDDRAFDLSTGESTRAVDARALERYAIRIEDNEVKVGPTLPRWSAGAA
jgi:3-phenylpropionate/trans-cinnamate dioxygenase ferredoxin subunit